MSDLEAYAKLSPWKPSELAGWRCGDLVEAGGLGRARVVRLIPPSLLEIQIESGRTVKVGWRAVRRVVE